MRAIIVDDESKAIISLKGMLDIFTEDIDVVATASSKAKAVELIAQSKPELVFLDIELQDGSGMDVLEHFPNRNFLVIFVTAYDQYAVQALRMKAFDYLLKPVDPDDLEKAVEKAKTYDSTAGRAAQLTQVDKISVPSRNGLIFIKLENIIRLQSDNTYTNIIQKDHKPILITKTLKSFENTLKDSHFFRVHQSHIVNFKEVVEYTHSDGGHLVMSNGVEIPLSRSNKSMIEKAIELRLLNL